MSGTNRGKIFFWIAVLLVFIAMLVAIGGFATPGWYTGKYETFGHEFKKSIGLWSCILTVAGHTTVGQLEVNGEFAPFFEGTRALSAIGTILLVLAFLMSFIFCCTRHKRITSAAVCLFVTLGGIIVLVGVALFAGYIHTYYDSSLTLESSTYLDYSYYMQVVAGILALLAACLYVTAGAMSRPDTHNDW